MLAVLPSPPAKHASAVRPKKHYPSGVRAAIVSTKFPAYLVISPESRTEIEDLVGKKNLRRAATKKLEIRDQFSATYRTPNKSLAVRTPSGTILRHGDIDITIGGKPFDFFCSDIPSNPPEYTAIPAIMAQNELQKTLGLVSPHNTQFRLFQKRVTYGVVEAAKKRGRPSQSQSDITRMEANEYIKQVRPDKYYEIVSTFAQMNYKIDPFAWLHEIGCCIEDQNPQRLTNFTIGTAWANTVMTAIESAIVDAVFLQKVQYLDVEGHVEHELLDGSKDLYTYLATNIVYTVTRPDGLQLKAEIPPYLVKKQTAANAILKYLAYAFFSGFIGDPSWNKTTATSWLAKQVSLPQTDMSSVVKNLFP